MHNDNFDDLDENNYEIIKVTNEDGVAVDCFIIDTIANDGVQYLLVVSCEDFEEDEAEAFILKQIEDNGEEIIYTPVEDDNEYNKVLILFQENQTDYEMEF